MAIALSKGKFFASPEKRKKYSFHFMESSEPFNKQSWEREKLENPVINERDKARERASDLQRRAAEIQAARYERTLYRLMERSGNNGNLINALNTFTRVLDSCSFYGIGDQQLPPTEAKRLTQFFEKKTEELGSIDS